MKRRDSHDLALLIVVAGLVAALLVIVAGGIAAAMVGVDGNRDGLFETVAVIVAVLAAIASTLLERRKR